MFYNKYAIFIQKNEMITDYFMLASKKLTAIFLNNIIWVDFTNILRMLITVMI